jgi:UMF1 family MFS transporter
VAGERYREWAWCLYDWGNSAFALVCMTAVLPPFVASLINAERGAPAGTVAWGWTAAAGLALGVVLGPPLGALADARGVRKVLLAAFAGVGVVATAGLALVLPLRWPAALLLYVVAATGFAGANLFYDALLPGLAPPSSWDRLSARGYAAGYAGGGVALAVVAALSFALGTTGLRWGFVFTAVWWAVFTVPLLLLVAEPPWGGVARPLERLRTTLAEARRHRMLWRFLLAYWLYNDAIGTIIKMAAAYGAEVGIPLPHLLGALLLTQLVGIPATLAFGRFAARHGARDGILLALGGYGVVCVGALFLEQAWQFWVLAAAVGVVQGGAQALSRSLYARLVPPQREAEFFSFFDVSGRVAGIAGPALFALVAGVSASGRGGVGVVLALFLVGGWVLFGVRPGEGRRGEP